MIHIHILQCDCDAAIARLNHIVTTFMHMRADFDLVILVDTAVVVVAVIYVQQRG